VRIELDSASLFSSLSEEGRRISKDSGKFYTYVNAAAATITTVVTIVTIAIVVVVVVSNSY